MYKEYLTFVYAPSSSFPLWTFVFLTLFSKVLSAQIILLGPFQHLYCLDIGV